MGVYIKGMEMPKNCMLCPLCAEEADPANGEMCMVTGTLMPPCTRERLDNCPLIPVPPHGRLIDVKGLENMYFSDGMYDAESNLFVPFVEVASAIFNAPTIIPVDLEEEGE